jgi:hypothetical protein
MSTRVKISYRIMVQYPAGTWSEPFQSEGFMDENPDHEHVYSAKGDCMWPGCKVHRNDMGGAARPFSSGFPTLESTSDTVASAIEWAAKFTDSAEVWVERITETTEIERMNP